MLSHSNMLQCKRHKSEPWGVEYVHDLCNVLHPMVRGIGKECLIVEDYRIVDGVHDLVLLRTQFNSIVVTADTMVMLYNGNWKMAKDIVVGTDAVYNNQVITGKAMYQKNQTVYELTTRKGYINVDGIIVGCEQC